MSPDPEKMPRLFWEKEGLLAKARRINTNCNLLIVCFIEFG
jgi:hypothetical protein